MDDAIIKTVVIDKVDCKETKTSKNNKQYCSVGIEVNGKWYNGLMWEKQIDTAKQWKPKDELMLIFFQEEYQGKMYSKFKLPTKENLIQEITTIKKDIVLIKEHLKI